MRIVVLLLLALGYAAGAQAQLPTQKSVAGGVTVTVTPRNVGVDARVWDFAVVLDTHSQDLSDDIGASSALAGDSGAQSKALGWDGAGPGGHHRAGVLKFEAIAPRPKTLELRITRAGEPKPRVFRWELP